MALSSYNRPFLFSTFDDIFDPLPIITTPFDSSVGSSATTNNRLLRSSPGYEINEDEKKFQLSVDVPGVKSNDMKVELEQDDRVLHIYGGRKVTKQNSITETKFDKRFTIGNDVDKTKLTANLADGVLVVTAPKKEKENMVAHTINITEGPHHYDETEKMDEEEEKEE